MLAGQSLSAFGDNAVYAVIVGILLQAAAKGEMTLSGFGVASAVYANCLFLPYVALAPVLGWLSDRFKKKTILVSANLIKACGCIIAFAGLAGITPFLMVSYLVIGIGAAVYSPSKYGIIPELKDQEELVRANAAMEMTTIVAILAGIVAGGVLIDRLGPTVSFMILTGIYAAATLFNCAMSDTGIFNRDEKLSASMRDFNCSLRTSFNDKALFTAVFGTSIFWGAASFVKLNLQTWGQQAVGLTSATDISLLALWLSIGIILGSFAAGRVYKTGEIRQSWLTGFLMGAAILAMIAEYSAYGLLAAELILIGTLGGLFVIPLNTVIQARATHRTMGKMIAVQNLFENGAMLASCGLFWMLNSLAMPPAMTFALIGALVCALNLFLLRPALINSRPAGSGNGPLPPLYPPK